MSGCVFCAIAAGELEAAVVHSDERFIAFLDRRPLFQGHVLICPREHHETLADLPPELGGPLIALAQRVCRALEAAMDAQGTFVANNNKVSQSVPHLHVHVVPRRPRDGLRGFFWPRTAYADDAEMADVAARIREALAATASP